MLYLQPGSMVIPDHMLLHRLGRGAYGEVWLAEDKHGVQLALKFVELGQGAGEKELLALQWIKNIRHPQILPVIGMWLLDGRGVGRGHPHPFGDRYRAVG